MPEIARFNGLTVAMYYRDHEPPHVHCHAAEHHATVVIATGVLYGRLTTHDRRVLLAWIRLRRADLMKNWIRARAGWPLIPVAPPE